MIGCEAVRTFALALIHLYTLDQHVESHEKGGVGLSDRHDTQRYHRADISPTT